MAWAAYALIWLAVAPASQNLAVWRARQQHSGSEWVRGLAG